MLSAVVATGVVTELCTEEVLTVVVVVVGAGAGMTVMLLFDDTGAK